MTGSSQRSSQLNVVVTGVGAIIGQGIVHSLRRSTRKVRVIGIDRNANSMGPDLCDVFFAKPTFDESSPDYLTFWQEILIRESVDLVLPGLEIDVFFLDGKRQYLGATSATLGLNRSDLIALARDKWNFGQEISRAGLKPIPTVLAKDWDDCIKALGMPPFLLKPREGNGSRGITRICDELDFRYWTKKSDDGFMIQKIIGTDDDEYTVGAFGFGDGNSLKPIVFRRRLSPAGNTQYAEVVTDSAIEQATVSLSRHFKPVGPTNYQFRKEDGIPYLLEINPRLSSSSSLRTGFGYNEADMAISFYIDGIRPDEPTIRQGRAWRYFADHFSK